MALKKSACGLARLGLTVMSLLAVSTAFSSEDGNRDPRAQQEQSGIRTATVEVQTITEWYDAVGTVVPKTQARIEPRIAAQVNDVLVQAGDEVEQGELLIQLEDNRLTSKLSQARQSLQSAIARREQARQGVNSAEAAFSQAKSAFTRIERFYQAQASTEQEFEEARSRFLQAKAALQRAEDGLSGAAAGIRLAEEMVEEATIALTYCSITAPTAGKILKRLVDPGDMAMPGKPLLILRTAGGLQLEASVREGLMGRIRLGDTRSVELPTIGRTVDATVAEIVPFIDPLTRTFLVKASLPEAEDTYPGMYGKLLIPVADIQVILVPRTAVRQIGQLELVLVSEGDSVERRFIKTGRLHDDTFEVLSGLNGGEQVVLESENDV
jgi:HlyD family secretion protein